MKFGIITLVSDNYGNKFQNYAVERILSKYGEVITYPLEDLYQNTNQNSSDRKSKYRLSYVKKVIRARMMYQYDYAICYKNLLSSIWYVWKHRKKMLELQNTRKKRFSDFSLTHLHIANARLNYQNVKSEKWIKKHDCFICGSDQIWNPTYSTTSELAFCSFAPEKTVAWAPSFGVSNIPECRINEYRNYLRNISSLSVREEAGANIIKTLTGRDTEVLLDPTMTLHVDEWKKLAKKPTQDLPKKYIVCYFLGQIDRQYKKQIDDFSKKINMPIVMLFDITDERYYTFNPSEVLYTIEHAEYVLTDSFHGTVFSILFHRNFYVFKRNEGGMSMHSRLDTLLSKFQLATRYHQNMCEDITEETWKIVENVLSAERLHTETYVRESIKKLGFSID